MSLGNEPPVTVPLNHVDVSFTEQFSQKIVFYNNSEIQDFHLCVLQHFQLNFITTGVSS